jgi:hypothetical protein
MNTQSECFKLAFLLMSQKKQAKLYKQDGQWHCEEVK